MTPLASVDQKSGLSVQAALNPPHGLKGALEADPVLGPRGVMGLGVFVLVCVIILIALIRALNKLKDFRLKNTSAPDVAVVKNEPSLLSQINTLKLPVEDYETDDQRRADWARFSSEASVILRRAVELRTNLPVTERTTSEICGMVEVIDNVSLTAVKSDLLELLIRLDQITFAGRIPSVSDATKLIAGVKALVVDLSEDNLPAANREISSGNGVRIFD